MGREIRRVPADWQHPRYTAEDAPNQQRVGEYKPLFDNDYESAAEEWIHNLFLWVSGKHPRQLRGGCDYRYFWEWYGGPPDIHSYRDRKWTADQATHYQMYETVSEGTPVTPAFPTKAALIEHLVKHGTDYDRKGWPKKAAEAFVEHEWAPSMIAVDGEVKTVRDEGFYPQKGE